MPTALPKTAKLLVVDSVDPVDAAEAVRPVITKGEPADGSMPEGEAVTLAD